MRSPIHVAAAVALMTACSPTHESASTPDSSASHDSLGPTSSRNRTPSGVAATLDLPKASVSAGEPVAIRLVLRNGGAHDTELSVVGSVEQRFDIIVLDSAGSEVWSRLHRQDIDLGRNVLPLRAGDSLVFSEQWNQRDNGGRVVPPGVYEVRGHLSPRASGDSALAIARLRIRLRNVP